MAGDIKNKITSALVEAWTNGNTDAFDGIFSPEFVGHSPSGPDYKLEDEKAYILDTHQAFSENKMEVTNVYQDGDTVIVRWIWSGKHTGQSQFMPGTPTGKDCTLYGCTFYRVESGNIVEGLHYSNETGLLKQLGLIPENPYAQLELDDRTPRGENL